jgi:hypothetical protein
VPAVVEDVPGLVRHARTPVLRRVRREAELEDSFTYSLTRP